MQRAANYLGTGLAAPILKGGVTNFRMQPFAKVVFYGPFCLSQAAAKWVHKKIPRCAGYILSFEVGTGFEPV